MVAHKLAQSCGLDVPQAKLAVFSAAGSTFLTKRFDRAGKTRIHFASAMTMLGEHNNTQDSSYMDIAFFLEAYGSNVQRQLQELWDRMVFNMLISNTDDHLRNHGFLLSAQGWQLSPLYDVNPTPYGDSLSLRVAEESSLISLDAAIEVAPYFQVAKDRAQKRIREMRMTVRDTWRKIAIKCQISRASMEKMKAAFYLADEM